MEQMAEKLHKGFSTLVDVVVKNFDSRMEEMQVSIKEIQETSKNIETRMYKFEAVKEGVKETGLVGEELVKDNGSQEDTTCSNKPRGKNPEPVRKK